MIVRYHGKALLSWQSHEDDTTISEVWGSLMWFTLLVVSTRMILTVIQKALCHLRITVKWNTPVLRALNTGSIHFAHESSVWAGFMRSSPQLLSVSVGMEGWSGAGIFWTAVHPHVWWLMLAIRTSAGAAARRSTSSLSMWCLASSGMAARPQGWVSEAEDQAEAVLPSST